MTRYLIIIGAVLVGAFIGWILSKPKKAAADTVLEEQRPLTIWPFVGAFVALMLGLLVLSDFNRASIDSDYQPAVIDGDKIKPGQFEKKE